MKKFLLFLAISISILNGETISKKEKFMNETLPLIVEVHNELLTEYQEVKYDIENNVNIEKIEKYKRIYEVENNEELLFTMKPHPISLTLAQAQIESNWGTSRFALKRNNLFGIWSFNKEEQRLKRGEKRNGKSIFVRLYNNQKESIKDYYKLLSKSKYYKDFQELKNKTDNPYKIANGLLEYSEKGDKYVSMVINSIKKNGFYKFDN